MQTEPGSEPSAAGSVPPTPPQPPGPSPVSVGWGPAIRWAVATVLTLAALAEVIAFLGASATKQSPGLVLTVRAGGLLFCLFHRVGTVVSVSGAGLGILAPGPRGGSYGVTLVVALLGGSFIAIAMLARGGRSIGALVDGPAWVGGLHGMKVAVPYAVLCLLGAFALTFTVTVRAPAPELVVHIHPSYLAALLWPLAIGGLAGFLGGYRSAPEAAGMASAWERRIRGALAGGVRMIVLGLAFAFAGLLVMAVVQPHATSLYFKGVFAAGTLAGITALILNTLFVPNLAAWVLFPSMGSCVGASGGGFSVCLLSYSHFPSSAAGASVGAQGPSIPNLPAPTAPYFLFILVPIVAVLIGGKVAARRASVATRPEGIAVGAGAGVVFGLLALVLAVASGIAGKVGAGIPGIGFGGTARIGPDLVSGTALALLWGIVGGSVGGLRHSRALPSAAAPAPPQATPLSAAPAPPPSPVPSPPPAPPPSPEPPPAAEGVPPDEP